MLPFVPAALKAERSSVLVEKCMNFISWFRDMQCNKLLNTQRDAEADGTTIRNSWRLLRRGRNVLSRSEHLVLQDCDFFTSFLVF